MLIDDDSLGNRGIFAIDANVKDLEDDSHDDSSDSCDDDFDPFD